MSDCNTPPQQPCGPGPFRSPACYTVPPSETVLPGYKEVTLNPDCSLATSTILDSVGAPAVGAVEAPCAGACTDCAGTVVTALPITVQDEGVLVSAGVTCLNFVGGAISAAVVGNCVDVTVTAGAVAFPVLAPNGSCAAPSYSFSASPDSGMFYTGTAVRIGDDNCVDFIEVGASISIFSSASTVDIQGQGIGITSGLGLALGSGGVAARLTILSAGDWNIGGSVGAVGEVITSNGAGLPPTWQAAGGGVAIPLNRIPIGTGPGLTSTLNLFYDVVTGGFGISGGVQAAPAGSFIFAAAHSGAGAGGTLTIAAGGSAAGPGGTLFLNAGTGVTKGNVIAQGETVQIATGPAATTRLTVEADGSWNIGGSNGTAGQVLVSNGAAAPPTWQTPTSVAGSTVTWGATNLSNTADTRVIPPGYNDGVILNTDTPRGFGAPRAGTFRNLFVRHNLTNGNGNSITYTLRVNGVLTALTATLATGAVGQASDLANSVAVVQGDLIEMVRIIPALVGSAVQNAIISAQFN